MGVEDVFKLGPLRTQILTISGGRGEESPPKPLMAVVPSVQGDYPVLLFLHGYLLVNRFYTQLLHHIASHGYITIAPQMDSSLVVSDATGDIEDAVAITEWLRLRLSEHLPEKVLPDIEKVAIAGHSRGGKVAFGAALGKTPAIPSSPYAAILGIDPVDGEGRGKQTQPPILTYKEHSFPENIPTLVIGSGLGPLNNFLVIPPCAPTGVNHVGFFQECCAPAYHFVAVDYGHMDFLNDETSDWMGFTYWMCRKGAAREPMRRSSGGIIVAFLNAWLRKKMEVLDELVGNPSLIPVKVEPPQCYPLEKALEFN